MTSEINPALENDDFIPALVAALTVSFFLGLIIFCAVGGRILG